MAIHFNYIKGLNGNVTKLSTDTTTSDSDDLYTFIKWAGRSSGASISQSADYTPEIHINKVNSLSGATSLGHIITDSASGQIFTKDIAINYNKGVYFNSNTNSTQQIQYYLKNFIWNNNDTLYIGPSATDTSNSKNIYSSIVVGCNFFRCTNPGGTNDIFAVCKKETSEDTTKGVVINAPLVFGSYNMSFNGLPKDIGLSTSNVKAIVNTDGSIQTSNFIDALYFNATSDKRAKENIQPATYNAIKLIKELPIYTYNYKNKTETVTGILAQDLLEAQPKELDLVSNVNATGENGDYMSIKNDKLVFILMKAIQEQQEQIEKLQEELNKLKESQ